VGEDVRIHRRADTPGVARVVFDRADRRNAVTASMLGRIRDALRDLASDGDIRAVILTGEGHDFCAGADLEELETARAAGEGRAYARVVEDTLAAIEAHPVPVIAQVRGAALGAGCQIVVACDLAVAAEDARLGIPSGRLGVVINLENMDRLVQSVGRKRAGAMLHAGAVCTGTEAVKWGLVNEAVPVADLEARTSALALVVAASAPLSVRGSKLGIRAVASVLPPGESVGGLAEAFDRAAEAAFASEDLLEGIRSFGERRAPTFRGT
jgi:enoyl-CoA hydratase/carnithine racemase